MRHVTVGALSLLGTDNEKPDSRGDHVGMVARIRFTSDRRGERFTEAANTR